MKADIVRGIDITNTFEQIVISENGKTSMFLKVAENMMADYIQSIQIAPDGVVTEIYSEAGMNAHVSKTVEMKVLEKTIRSIKSGGGTEPQVIE